MPFAHHVARHAGNLQRLAATVALQVPWSDQFHLVERIRRVKDGNVLEIDVTIEDPVAFKEPLHGVFYFKKDPSLEFAEWNCDGFFDYEPFAPKDAKP